MPSVASKESVLKVIASSPPLIERTSRRVLRHRQLNIVGFFLPLTMAAVIISYMLLERFALSLLLMLIPVVVCSGFMALALWKARKAVKREAVAVLLDEKTDGQERFLTLATVPQTQLHTPFLALVQNQAAECASSFEPRRDLPFRLDRRVPVALLGLVLCLLALFFMPPGSHLSPLAPEALPSTILVDLEEVARLLMTQGNTPQEQTTGAQLLALVQDLKDPSLSPQNKLRLIDEALQRMNLPLPQILPFDLKLFASESKDEGKGTQQGDQPRPESEPLARAHENLERLKKALSAAAGNEPQSGPPQDTEKPEQSQPRETAGGIQFNLPQQQTGEKQERTGQEPPGQQQSAQKQQPENRGAGSDPQQPGQRQPDRSRNSEERDPSRGAQQISPEDESKKGTSGQGRGERFLQPGEQPGGFLTEDARFVKVRIPAGQEDSEGDGQRTENRSRAVPKTPFSNAPLQEGPPDRSQPQQPIPLEYRNILQR